MTTTQDCLGFQNGRWAFSPISNVAIGCADLDHDAQHLGHYYVIMLNDCSKERNKHNMLGIPGAQIARAILSHISHPIRPQCLISTLASRTHQTGFASVLLLASLHVPAGRLNSANLTATMNVLLGGATALADNTLLAPKLNTDVPYSTAETVNGSTQAMVREQH